jgi:hypothetical protein
MTLSSRPKAVFILVALVPTTAVVLLIDPGRLAAWQSGGGAGPAARPEDSEPAWDLTREGREVRDRFRINRDLERGLMDGRFSFPEAAELYWENNHDVPGFVTLLEQVWGGAPPEVAARLNLLRLVRQKLAGEPARRTVVTDRLVAEYEGVYESFPLAAPEQLDR